jgi:tetratricopeptide (TPR) repeat protein
MPASSNQARVNVPDRLHEALGHQQRGQLARAEDLYRQVLDVQPDNFDALHLYGVLKHQSGQPLEALKLIGEALRHNARAATAHANYASVLAALDRHQDALEACDRALALKPDYAEALLNRGNALAALGRADEALQSFEQAIKLRPGYAPALINSAQLLQRFGRRREAIVNFDRAFAVHQPDADALVARGNTHYEMGSFAAALADYDRALKLRPDAAPLYNNRGNALRELGRHEEALPAFDRAIALKPDYAHAYSNRGNAQVELNRQALGLADYDRALELDPDFADALVNRGNALHDLGRFPEALANFNSAIALAPELAEAYWNRALTYLMLGDFEHGLPDYEWRWRRKNTDMAPRDFAQPQWRGEELGGRTILLHAEQGFGDSIQFIRYLPSVVAKGGRVLLEIPDDLRQLIGPCEGVAAVLRRGEMLPPFDTHCPLMSLPFALGTRLATIPAPVPYLHASPARLDKMRARLAGTKGPRVGLVWSGKPTHKNDHNRSIPLAEFAPILAQPGVQFVGLQKEYRERDRATLAKTPLLRLDAGLADFADTAAAIDALDLVIAVDTAVAHLAGAMGKPLWLLLPAAGDWRWMVDRKDSPWYPTARLFRQPQIGDWASVMTQVRCELASFMHRAGG